MCHYFQLPWMTMPRPRQCISTMTSFMAIQRTDSTHTDQLHAITPALVGGLSFQRQNQFCLLEESIRCLVCSDIFIVLGVPAYPQWGHPDDQGTAEDIHCDVG